MNNEHMNNRPLICIISLCPGSWVSVPRDVLVMGLGWPGDTSPLSQRDH